jgi:hypothetical protein
VKKSIVAALCAAAALSGCYVIPIDPFNPPAPGQVVAAPGGGAVVVPPSQPVPTILRARLYPLNETAGKMGALTATVTDSVNGHAVFSLTHGGEMLQGEASRVAAGYPGFGNVHREVYGDGRMPSGQRGIASASGTAGTYVNCEYALNGPNRGTGACLFSNGAKYQLHFGS